jgi:hypothetical protein
MRRENFVDILMGSIIEWTQLSGYSCIATSGVTVKRVDRKKSDISMVPE